jgi:hypothetical protein
MRQSVNSTLISGLSNIASKLSKTKLWTIGSTSVIAIAIGYPTATLAQTNFPNLPNLQFQTSSPRRCANIGDWYTTDGTGTEPNCGSTFGQNTTSTDKIHRLVFNITQADITAGGGSVTITINDAESYGALDEVLGTGDPTQYSLRDENGITILQGPITVQSGTSNGIPVTFTITTPGTYQVTSVAGAQPIFGNNIADLNNDDNTFTVTASITGLLIGFFQGSSQFSVARTAPYSLYFLKPPTANPTSLFLRNFDYDGSPTSIRYINPSGGTIAGTVSNNALWNGPSPNLNTSGDTVTAQPLTDAGIWRIEVSNTSATNQFILEANANGQRLALYDTPPPTAGNFLIASDTTRSTTIGTTVCHPFSVTNLFSTNDIVNLTTANTTANYTVQLRNAAGTTVLTDTDGNSQLDTGILAPQEVRNFTLCVTPNAGVTTADVTRINAVSFMDTKANSASNKTLFVDKTTTIPPRLSLVKRITALNNAPFTGFAGNTSDPNSNGDTLEDTNWPNNDDIYLRGAINGGVVKPSDVVEYTIYFLVSRNPTNNVTICDLIPANQTFVPSAYNGISSGFTEPGVAASSDTGIALGLNNTTLPTQPTLYLTNLNDSDRGRYLPPNDPTTPSTCQKFDLSGNPTASGPAANDNGAIVVNVVEGTNQLPPATGTGTPSNSYGFIRFRARVR